MEQQSSQQDHNILDSGELVYGRRRGGECVTEHKIDLLVLRLVCEECVEENNLAVKDGRYVMTAGFLLDLAGRLNDVGVDGCTPTEARQLWMLSTQTQETLKNDSSGMPS
jgi:hypothetical protein